MEKSLTSAVERYSRWGSPERFARFWAAETDIVMAKAVEDVPLPCCDLADMCVWI